MGETGQSSCNCRVGREKDFFSFLYYSMFANNFKTVLCLVSFLSSELLLGESLLILYHVASISELRFTKKTRRRSQG